MFTGIVEEIGKVTEIAKSSTGAKLTLSACKVTEETSLGDSVSVNGVCLTLTKVEPNLIALDVMNETLEKSMLKELRAGSVVNLERAMTMNSRLGGHIVTGHIDGVGTVAEVKQDGIGIWYTIKAASEILKYIVEKGSVCISGVSLTVAGVDKDSFKVCVIPHTRAETTLTHLSKGSVVNIENDILGKYVEKFLSPGDESGGSDLTMQKLIEAGF